LRDSRALHEVFGPSQPLPPDTAKKAARFWIGEHRAELARLKRGDFKQALPDSRSGSCRIPGRRTSVAVSILVVVTAFYAGLAYVNERLAVVT
jgi:hypothetical protein